MVAATVQHLVKLNKMPNLKLVPDLGYNALISDPNDPYCLSLLGIILNKEMTLKDLEPGQTAIVESVSNGPVGTRLKELGCLPGEGISVERIAPFGETMAVSFSDIRLCIRGNEAENVSVKSVD